LCGFFSSSCLLHLVIIVASGQRNYEFQLLHESPWLQTFGKNLEVQNDV
jgi:hypothetical protein